MLPSGMDRISSFAYVWSIRKTKAVKERLKAIQKAGKLAYKYAQTSLLFVLTPTFYSLSFINTPTQNAREDILPSLLRDPAPYVLEIIGFLFSRLAAQRRREQVVMR